MKTFLGMEVEQGNAGINLHLDYYIQTVLTEYKDYIKKLLRPKKCRSLQVSFFILIKYLQCRISSNRSTTGHLWLNFSLR